MTPEEVHDIQAMIQVGIREVLDNPNRYGLTWRRLPGTVVDGDTPTSVTVVLDGDDHELTVTSLVGTLATDQRVMVDVVPPSGMYAIGYQGDVPGYRYSQTVYFTASGTFTKANYPGLRAVMFEGVGPGGGSGGCAATIAGQAAAAAGGGGGGYARKFFLASTLSATTTVTVGSGVGTAAPAGANNGSTGTSTVFSSVTCPGGTGGIGSAATATYVRAISGVGGTPTGGDINIIGGDGGFGIRSGGEAVSLGFGGASLLGGSTRVGNTGAATTGRLYGGGAGGAYSDAGVAARPGADGADGIVILHLYV